MNSFKNNHRRNRYRSNGDRNFKKRNGDSHKFNSDYSSNVNFQRKAPGRNNHNASKLVDKYNDLAREALSKGDKILSENYFQHADHFARILLEKENYKILKEKNHNNQNNNEINSGSVETNTKQESPEISSNKEEAEEKQL
tara:strand:- start:1485 stop:1907 length:423 start_codon:yes stop_codon:yes gene_type:complete